jgi:hypothetical protein
MHHVKGREGPYQKFEFNIENMKCIKFTYEGPKKVLLTLTTNWAYASRITSGRKKNFYFPSDLKSHCNERIRFGLHDFLYNIDIVHCLCLHRK